MAFVHIFWNPVERRIRSLWRLIAQFITFQLLTLFVALGVQVAAVAVLSARGQLELDLSDPVGLSAALLEALSALPWAMPVISVGSLAAMFISLIAASYLLDRRPFRDFGFRVNGRWVSDLGFGLVLGALLMAIIFVFELMVGWVEVTDLMHSYRPEQSFWTGIIWLAVTYLAVGFYEEMLSRGYHLRNMAEGLNLKFIKPIAALLLGWVISSSLFGLAHLGNPNATWVSSANIAIAGLFLGLGYILTRELAIPIGIHITWNFFQGGVFGFPVSGTGNSASFIAIRQGGPEFWTGGAFGPEAGLLGLGAMFLGMLLIWLWVRITRGDARLKEDLAIYQPARKPAAVTPPETL